MKKIVGSVVTLAALVVVSYSGTGFVTERTLKKNIDMINQSSGLSVEMVHYRRGFFRSNAQLTWQLQTPERLIKNQAGQSIVVPAKTLTMDMPISIHHGPIIYANDGVHFGLGYASSQLTWPEAYQAKFAEYFSPDSITPKLDLNLFITYLAETHLHVNMPAFRLITNQNKSQFEWLGMTSVHNLSLKEKKVEGQITVNGIRATKDGQVAVLEKVTSDYDLHQSPDGLYLGEVKVDVPSLVVTEEGKPRFEMLALKASSSSDVVDALFGSSFHASVDKILLHEKSYGPGQIGFAIKNLDAAVLADLNEKANQLQQGTEIARQQALLALLPELPKLLGKGATIELSELHMVMPEGPVDGSIRVTLPKGDMGNPFQLVQKIEGMGSIKIPSVLLRAMLVSSEENKLLAEAMKPEPHAVIAPNAAVTTSTTVSVPATAATADVVPVPADVTPAQEQPVQVTQTVALTPAFEQKAGVEADKKIADLLKAGALVVDGKHYVIDMKLAAGQLSVNGHPFNASMLQF